MPDTDVFPSSSKDTEAPDRRLSAKPRMPGGSGQAPLTVIVPAYNEAAMIAETVVSIRNQTVAVAAILVVDDGSSDDTGRRAADAGATVLRPPANTGSKAGAQNFALAQVATPLVMAVDADTTLAPDAIERLLSAFSDSRIAAVCGFVVPRHVRTVWERGRYLEYLFAFGFYKPIQDALRYPLIASGCFSAYRTSALRQLGGWPTRTLTEDMDLTWSLYQQGLGVRFIPEAVCYPVEPHDFHFMRKQLRRWSHGFVQNVRLHWRRLLHLPGLRGFVAVAFWDAAVASLVYVAVIPWLAIGVSPLFLLGYVIDAPVVMVPVFAAAIRRRELKRAILSLPGFFVLRTINAFFMLEAIGTELIAKRTFRTYEKGH